MSSTRYSLDPKTQYTMVGLVDTNRLHPGWSVRGLFSGDEVAGMVAALINIVPFLSTSTYTITIKSKSLTLNFDPRIYAQTNLILAPYLEYTLIHPDQFERYPVTPPNYGWWIVDRNVSPEPLYQLYRFKTYDFVKGFIAAAKAFGVDFRSYMWGTPFQSTPRGEPLIYNIPGYDINETVEARPPIGAYYTGSYEATDYDWN